MIAYSSNDRLTDCAAILPGWWRFVLIAISGLILTACRAPEGYHGPVTPGNYLPQSAPVKSTMSAPQNIDAANVARPAGVQLASATIPVAPIARSSPSGQTPMPVGSCAACDAEEGPWAPPGIRRPWPADEYLCDGGDRNLPVGLATDWTLLGLDQEDTVAHADTKDGRVIVAPSNKICIYAPRFASVRKIDPAGASQQIEMVNGAQTPLRVAISDDVGIPTTALQQQPPKTNIGNKKITILRERDGYGVVANELSPRAFQDRYKPYEDLLVIKTGILEQAEKAYLLKRTKAAIVWSHDQGAQVILDHRKAMSFDLDQQAEVTYTTEEPNCPKLRVIKCASTDTALPGDVIDFTIRYDNVGNASIGNVTIVDNLTTRLEYIQDTAQSSLKASFSTQVNEGDSLVLRWEVADPLPPGKGGVLRFQCRVR